MPYFYTEFKTVSRLKLSGLKESEIKKMAVEENLFMVKTETRRREIASRTLERIEILDDYLVDIVVNGTIQTSKQIVLYTILKADLLFFEFMNEVFREKIILNEKYITDKDFSIFFTRKMEQSKQVEGWKDYTFYKLKQVYKRILTEAGLVKKEKQDLLIIPQMIEPDVFNHIKDKGDEVYLSAMIGER
jgi:hypothetical protein